MNFDVLGGLSTLGGYLVPFLFVLTVVVFFHELGHFLIARWFGIRVLVFSIGFGPELAGFYDRYGTRWKVSAVPLGGYVKFLGDENAASAPDRQAVESLNESEKREAFISQKVGARAAVVAAGPIANFILAIVIFAGLFMVVGKHTVAPRVEAVVPNSAAAAAGFQAGDLVLTIDGTEIDSFSDMQRIVSMSAGEQLTIEVEHDRVKRILKATPELQDTKDAFGNKQRIGVLGIKGSMLPGDIKVEQVSPARAVVLGAEQAWVVVDSTFSYIAQIFAGRASPDQLGGPIRIAQVSGKVCQSFSACLHLTGILSVSIGLLNLFPIPLLDGGHLLFYLVEVVRGRPLSERAQEVGFRIGLAIVLMLMIFATFNDILHLAAS